MALPCQELKQSTEHGNIIELTEVWGRYSSRAQETYGEIPPSFKNHLTTFKYKLVVIVHGIYEVFELPDQLRREPHTVLATTQFWHVPISAMKKNDQAELTIPEYFISLSE